MPWHINSAILEWFAKWHPCFRQFGKIYLSSFKEKVSPSCRVSTCWNARKICHNEMHWFNASHPQSHLGVEASQFHNSNRGVFFHIRLKILDIQLSGNGTSFQWCIISIVLTGVYILSSKISMDNNTLVM